MNNIYLRLMLFAQDYEHGGGGISRPDTTNDFADVMKQMFNYLQSYVFKFPFNGRIWNFTLWDLIKMDIACAIALYIISKIITRFGGNYE